MKLICMGDSLTFGFGMSRSVCWTTLLERETGWTVVNRGINGDTTGGMLSRLYRDVLLECPMSQRADCRVLVMGGSNDIFFSGSDSQARANLGAICHQLMAEGFSPMVGIPLPVDWTYAPRQWAEVVDFQQAALLMPGYCAWLRKFCSCFGLAAVDFSQDFLRPSGQVRHELFWDGLHPNAAGHRLMADRLKGILLF